MVFFDIDNTLIDHSFASKKAIHSVYMKYRNITDKSKENFEKSWKDTADVFFEQFLNNRLSFKKRLERIVLAIFPNVKQNDQVEEIVKYYLNEYENNWFLYSDVSSCLNMLKNYKLGIISNGSVHQQKEKLKKCGIMEYFDVIIISEEYHVAKPNFKIFEIACNQAKTTAENCIYIGNNLEHDILPFQEYGGLGIWVNRNNIASYPLFSPQINSLKDAFNIISVFF